jgi:hypothetical protein
MNQTITKLNDSDREFIQKKIDSLAAVIRQLDWRIKAYKTGETTALKLDYDLAVTTTEIAELRILLQEKHAAPV